MKQLFQESLQVMESAFGVLEEQVPKPQPIVRGRGYAFRYKEESIYQAIILKLARVVSGLHAALLLLKYGHTQEQAMFHRVQDELDEDILFLVFAISNDEITDLHKRYLKAFFEEEFDDIDDPIASPQKRPMIPRKKIRAYLVRMGSATKNPSRGIDLSRTINKAYSGFIHAASPHIMDMYGGNPPKFHLSGMLGTPRIEEYAADLWNYFYRGQLSFVGAAKAFGDKDLLDTLYAHIERFEKASGTTYQRDVRGPELGQ